MTQESIQRTEDATATVASSQPLTSTLRDAAIARNPAWVQLLGLCPLLAVSSSSLNALGLASATTLVIVGSNVAISLLRKVIPTEVRLPCFVLIIATLTTLATLLLEAYAYDLYLKIALFVQIIVTNCMILGRAEAFASRMPVGQACADALGTAFGFAIALITLGCVRELLSQGTLFANLDVLFGPSAASWQITVSSAGPLPLAAFAPGAFIIGGLLLALGSAIAASLQPKESEHTPKTSQ